MLKKPAVLITSLFLLLFVVTSIHAQEFNFGKSYQDYIYTQTQYDQVYSDYEDARDFYLKNKTLTLKEEARKKTLVMLRARDELMRVYLTALRLRIVEIRGLTQGEKDLILGKIDSEIAWYKSHKDLYKDSDPLEDLLNKSKESESRYKTNTSVTTYDSLFNISLGEMVGLRLDHEEIYKSIKSDLDKRIAEGNLKIDPFNRWLTDIDLVIRNLKDNEDKAKKIITKLYGESYTQPSSVFIQTVDALMPSIGLTLQLNNFLTEFLTSIENQI